MDYDSWLVWQEHEYRGWNDPDYTCMHCEKPIDKEELLKILNSY